MEVNHEARLPSQENDLDIQSQLKELLAEVKTQRREVRDLKNDVHNNSLSVSSEVKKLKSETQVTWRFKGNKVQYDFNGELDESINQVVWAIQHDKSDYAVDILKELADKLRRRNKLVRIADTSDGGWETVKLYESNPIASDSEDESRINRAESRALKRKKAQSQPKRGKRSSPFLLDHYQRHDRAPFNVGQAQASAQVLHGRPHLFRPSAGATWTPVNSTGVVTPGPCFACGESTHFRRDCPHVTRPAGSQTYSRK